jgi:chloride channel protein, CIC family
MLSPSRILGWLPRYSRPLVESGLYGLVAGLFAVAFEVSIALVFAATIMRFSHWSFSAFAVSSFLMLTVTSLASGWLLHQFAPEAAGSGIPQAKLDFWKDFGFIPWRILWVKFIAGVLAIGGGASLGREGPTVQLSAAAASNFSGFLGVAKTGRRRPTAAGCAAGLAATFNTPLAAIAFVLEEILGDLNSVLLGSVVVAAVLGAFCVHAILGSHPAFALPTVEKMTWRGQAFVPAAAVLAALVGVCFQFCALGLRRQFRSSWLRHIPAWTRPASGAVGTWVTGCIIFFATGRLGIFGIGYGDLTAGLNGELFGLVPVLLLPGKFTATVFSYGSGGCGGVFAPSLFLGAMAGGVVQEAALAMGVPLGPDDRLLLEVVGMSASLGSVVRAPFTSILIVFEMTREFSLVPSLLVAGVLSQALSRFILPHGFYEQVLADDGVVLNTVMPPRDFREWQNYPVSAIANFQPVVLDSLEPDALREVLGEHPFAKFLYQPDDEPPSVVLRADMERSLAGGAAPPASHTIPVCLRSDLISRVQDELVASGQGIVAVLDRENGAAVGLLTLHDILRAQQNLAAQHIAG